MKIPTKGKKKKKKERKKRPVLVGIPIVSTFLIKKIKLKFGAFLSEYFPYKIQVKNLSEKTSFLGSRTWGLQENDSMRCGKLGQNIKP